MPIPVRNTTGQKSLKELHTVFGTLLEDNERLLLQKSPPRLSPLST